MVARALFDLYDLAPVGYLTISGAGLIQETNLAAATLLGTSRGSLVGLPLTRFILPADQDIYYRCRRQRAPRASAKSCELRLRQASGQQVWGLWRSAWRRRRRATSRLWRLILIDIKRAQTQRTGADRHPGAVAAGGGDRGIDLLGMGYADE